MEKNLSECEHEKVIEYVLDQFTKNLNVFLIQLKYSVLKNNRQCIKM